MPVTLFYYYNEFEESYYYDDYNYYDYNETGIMFYNVLGLDSLWKAGIPNKSVWDTSHLYYSKPKALLTDTANSYPPNNHSVMEIKVKKPAWAAFYNYCWSRFAIGFSFACDTDSLKDGMYLEVSFDGGQSFANAMDTIAIKNIVNGPDKTSNYAVPKKSIIGDTVIGYTGKIFNEYYMSGGYEPYMESFQVIYRWEDINGFDVDSALVRMHFISDSIDNPKQGIMIDYLHLLVEEWCYYVGKSTKLEEDSTPYLIPNPISNNSKLRFNNHQMHEAKLIVYDAIGQNLAFYKTRDDVFELRKNQFKTRDIFLSSHY